MNKNKVLLLALLLAGISQSVHAYFNFSWSFGSQFGFRAPFFGFPVSVGFHAPVAMPYHPALIIQPVEPAYRVYPAPAVRRRPVREFRRPRPRHASRGSRFANWPSRSSLRIGLNFFA